MQQGQDIELANAAKAAEVSVECLHEKEADSKDAGASEEGWTSPFWVAAVLLSANKRLLPAAYETQWP
jgi:hypothetical protein